MAAPTSTTATGWPGSLLRGPGPGLPLRTSSDRLGWWSWAASQGGGWRKPPQSPRDCLRRTLSMVRGPSSPGSLVRKTSAGGPQTANSGHRRQLVFPQVRGLFRRQPMIANQAETAPAYRPTRPPCTRRAVGNMTTAMIVSLEPGIGRPDPRLDHEARAADLSKAASGVTAGSWFQTSSWRRADLGAGRVKLPGGRRGCAQTRIPAHRRRDRRRPPAPCGRPAHPVHDHECGFGPYPQTHTHDLEAAAGSTPAAPRRCWRLSPVSVEPYAERRCSWLEPRKGGAELVEGHPVTGQGQVAWCVRRIETAREQA